MLLLRWNVVRGILQSNQLDAILLVLGVDSCFNEGCSRLFDFLFGNKLQQLLKAAGNEDYEDIFVIITQTAIHLYCNPNNAHFVLPMASRLHDVRLHCLSAQQVESGGPLSEDYKARVFVSVLKDLPKIGVPYCGSVPISGSTGVVPFDPMKLEAWPLVQAYAAEDLGGHGFFTMTHMVVDVTSDLEALYSKLDPMSLTDLMKKGVPGYLQQWLGTLNASPSLGDHAGSLTHERLSESFSLYTRHRLAQGPPVRECEPSGVWPGHSMPIRGTSVAPLSDNHHRYPVHMVCHLCDPRGPLCAWRTYFPTPTPLELSEDAWVVQRLYCCLSAAVQLGIEAYVETQRPQKCHWDSVFGDGGCHYQSFVEKCEHMGLAEPLLSAFRDNLEVVIEHVDLVGRSQQTQRGVWRPLLNQIAAKVHSIPSLSHPHEVLGTVAYGDTFVDSMVILDEVQEEGSQEEEEQHDEQDEGQDVRPFIVLTSSSTRVRRVHGAQTLQFAAGVEGQWGDSVGNVGDVHLVNPVAPDCPICVKLHVYKDFLVISEPVFGAVSIPNKDMQSQLYNNEDQPATSPVVLVVKFSDAIRRSLPVEMLNEENTVVLVTWPHTMARRNLEQLKDFFQRVHELPETLEKIYHSYATSLGPLEVDKDAAIRSYELYFSKHFKLACSLHHPVRSRVLQCMSSSGPATMEGKVVVSIVTGAPGSYQDVLVSGLSDMMSKTEGDCKWILLRQPLDRTQEFSTVQLQESLATIVLNMQKKAHGRRRSLVTTKRCHVLLLTPGLTGALEVLQAVCTHPQKYVAVACTIGAIVLCVDPTNAYICGRTPFPNLLHNLNLATIVALTGSQQLPKHVTMAQEFQQWIKYCNPQCKVISAPKGVISRTSDVDLIVAEKRWKGVDALMDGHISCSGHICVHTLEPKFNVVVLRFMTVLSKTLLDQKCSELLPVESPEELSLPEGQIYHLKGCVQFGDHASFRYEFTRQSSELCVTEQDQSGSGEEPVPSVMVFTGIGLKEDVLKLWLQGCQHEATVLLPMRTKEDLTTDELHQLKQRCQQLPLPPGLYFTGHYYSSLDGEKSTEHPLLDDVISSYLAEQNATARDRNASTDTNFIWI
eukprot:Em0023g186a